MTSAKLKLALILCLKALVTFAVDLQPNDIVAPPPDKTYAMLSYYETENGTLYKNGSVVSRNPYSSPVINNPNLILRVSRSYSFEELPGVSYIQLPYNSIQPSGSLVSYPGTSGIGDVTLATAIWPYANHKNRTYLGIAGYLTLPTGSYNNLKPFNVGENRYKSDIQIGLQTPIIQNLDAAIAIDTMWFGGNGSCAAACSSSTSVSLSQKPLTTTQLGPIYKINEIFTLGASYFYVAGGATSINNIYQNNVINTQRFLISGLAYTDIGRFSLQYGRDIEITNGFIQTRVLALRYTKNF
jgi:hypothetical protein